MEEDNIKRLISVFLKNVFILTIFVFYFFLLSLFYLKLNPENKILLTKISSMIVLFIGIFIIEISYRKDSGKIALIGIETIMISFITLIIWTITKKYEITYQKYILCNTFILVVYYFSPEVFTTFSCISKICCNFPLPCIIS